jgi:hypothetical protein
MPKAATAAGRIPASRAPASSPARLEGEAEPAGSKLVDDVIPRFTTVVDRAAAEGKPRSLVILAHDTARLNATAIKGYVADMEANAVKKDVRLEHYTMSGFFQAVRGKAP